MSTEVAVLVIVLLVVLAAGSAYFSGVETALFSISRFRLRRWREKDPSTAAAFEKLMEKPRRILSVILLTDTLINIPLIIFAFALASSFETPIPVWVKATVIFALIVIGCDLIPKILALTDPYRFSKSAIQILQLIVPVVDPLSRALQRLADRTADLVTKRQAEEPAHLDDEELVTLVELSAEEGELRTDEREMIHAIIKLGNKTVGDCMTPRVNAFSIPDSLSNEEAIRELRKRRHGRVPVYGDSPDEILGVLDVKRFLLDPSAHYTETLEPPSYVPETMRALDLLRAFLTHRQRMAVVVDEFGGTEGVVTLNDILEEIIGDAVPRGDEALYIEEIGEGKWLASGSARLDDLGEAVGARLEHEGLDTIGGLIFNQLGYLPKPGTVVEIPPLQLHIRQSSRKRILEVLVQRMKSLSDGDEE
jgi:CBS domain containing-hemolysin-like protein